MQNQPELLEQFPYSTDTQWFSALQFVRKAPFAEDFWQTFKGLYKKVEQYVLDSPEACMGIVQKLVGVFLERIDQVKTADISAQRFPTIATLGYMKRRARRLLNHFGKTNPDIYVGLVKNLLAGQEGKAEIHSEQWICLDLFWGNSARYIQTGFGHNNYSLKKDKFQLKNPEERFSTIWEDNLQILHELLQKDLPTQVSEFAVKILERKQSNLPALSDKKLEGFFQSGSAWLQRVAVRMAYQKLTIQNISPELYAGLTLFASPELLKKVVEINKNRTQNSKDWENNFAESLKNTVWSLLQTGNNSRRVIHALTYLHHKYPTKLKNLNALAIAPALLQSKHKILQDLAFTSIQSAKKEDAMTWISALGTERSTEKDAFYDKIKVTLAGKFNKSVSAQEVRPFVFNTSFYIADFGWHLTNKMQEWYMYQLWNKFTQGAALYGKKREMFMHAIASPSGVVAFQRYYKYSNYFVNQFNNENLNFVLEYADKAIVALFIKYHKEQFQNYPLYNIQNLIRFPDAVRDAIFAEVLPTLKNKNIFDYTWYINNAFQQSVANPWLLEAIKQMIEHSNFTEQSAYCVLDAILHYTHAFDYKANVFAMLQTLSKGRQDQLLIVLSRNPSWLVGYASLFPATWRERALENLDITSIVNIARDSDATQWEVLKEAVYSFLTKNPQPSTFWKEILEMAIANPDSPLVARILENADCKKMFLQLQDASILDIAQPELEDLLSEWASANFNLFEMGSYELFRLCIHKLPKLRQAGYTLAKQHGITVTFGLRLMESDLPEAVGEAQTYFNALPAQSDTEWDALLGMIDSPNRQVRVFALDYWKARAEHLGTKPQLLPFLSEHADQAVQEAVAKEIKEKKVQNPFVQRFEKEVLRQKNKARKAKDVVKAHIEETLEIDAKTLIELAQSANKREAEWAIVQLTKKALAGEDTEGFVLD
jgi:hypothetical protein